MKEVYPSCAPPQDTNCTGDSGEFRTLRRRFAKT